MRPLSSQNVAMRVTAYSRFWLTALAVLVADRVTKIWVLLHIDPYTYYQPAPIPIWDGFYYIVHVYNRGAAWGLFCGYGIWLAILGAVALVSIFFLRKQLELKRCGFQYAFGLLVGGIIGNLWDRVSYGHVIDFIDIHLPGYRWPAFNIADMGISAGVALYMLLILLDERKRG